MESKHTPERWEAREIRDTVGAEEDRVAILQWVISTPDLNEVACLPRLYVAMQGDGVAPSYQAKVAEAESRANLIAAAPDMLAALKKIINNWDDLHPKDRQQARAAIAKAEGR